MISFAIGIGGLVTTVLILRVIAYHWIEKERQYWGTGRKAHEVNAAIIGTPIMGEAIEAAELSPGRVVKLRF